MTQNITKVNLTAHLDPVLGSAMSTAIPLLPLYAFIARTATTLPLLTISCDNSVSIHIPHLSLGLGSKTPRKNNNTESGHHSN
jgi:hypothetical protein